MACLLREEDMSEMNIGGPPPTVRCLAIFNTVKRAIHVGGNRNRDDVRAAVLDSNIGVDVDANLRVQVYDKGFQDFVDMDEQTTVENDDRINLFVERPDEARPATVVRAKPLHNLVQEPYKLPELPQDIQEELRKVTPASMPSTLRIRIVKWLHSDICRYELYPGKRNLYGEAARLLVFHHPQLKDSLGSGFDSWRIALRNRTKNQRRKLDLPEVLQERAKRKASGAAKTRTPAAAHAALFQPFPCAEDEVTILAHKLHMKREMAKRPDHRNLAKVEDSMNRTFTARRKWIEEERPTVGEVMKQYPALEIVEEVHREFTRMTGVNLEASVLSFINRSSEAILSVAKGHKAATEVLIQLNEGLHCSDSDTQKYFVAVAVLLLVPVLLREKNDHLFKSDPPPKGECPYPVVLLNSMVSHENAKAQVDDVEYELIDILAASTVALELYWVHNIVYHPKLKQTFQVLDYVLKLSTAAPKGLLAHKLLIAINM